MKEVSTRPMAEPQPVAVESSGVQVMLTRLLCDIAATVFYSCERCGHQTRLNN